MTLPSFVHGLQFRLMLGFAAVLALALAGVGAYSAFATAQETRQFAAEVEAARTERAEQLVSDAYEANEDWDQVQYTVQQVAMLMNWRVVVANADGFIVADSHELVPVGQGFFRQLEERGGYFSSAIRRPIYRDGELVGLLVVDDITPADRPPLRISAFEPRFGSHGGSFPFEVPATPESITVLPGTQGSSTQTPTVAEAVAQELIPEPPLSKLEGAFQRSLIIAGAGAGAAGLLMVALFTRHALAPVRGLTAAARKLGSGDLAYRVPEERNDELGELARTFNEMAHGLESAEAQRRKMTADIAHELRTPLTNIQGYLEAIKDGVLQPDSETLDTIYQQVIHLARLVEDLRLLSIADAGALRLERNADSLASLANDAVADFRPRAAEQRVSLTFDAVPDVPLVEIDRTRMRQVVANLVENALAYTPEGGRVDVRVESPQAGLVRLSVADTGRGIAAADLPRIFDQFYRVDHSRTRRTGGAGLGLTIVKRLVEAHGGTVSVDSLPGRGTTFRVDLPAAHGVA